MSFWKGFLTGSVATVAATYVAKKVIVPAWNQAKAMIESEESKEKETPKIENENPFPPTEKKD